MHRPRGSSCGMCIADLVSPAALRNRSDPWWRDVKASDQFLDRVMEVFATKLGIPNLMRKSDYHELARFVPVGQIDPEVTEVLEAIVETAKLAKPVLEE